MCEQVALLREENVRLRLIAARAPLRRLSAVGLDAPRADLRGAVEARWVMDGASNTTRDPGCLSGAGAERHAG